MTISTISSQDQIAENKYVHVCWKKFALYFDVASRTIPIQNEECILTVEQVAEAIDENTIAVICVLGNTYTKFMKLKKLTNY